jgi:hypothetical protein
VCDTLINKPRLLKYIPQKEDRKKGEGKTACTYDLLCCTHDRTGEIEAISSLIFGTTAWCAFFRERRESVRGRARQRRWPASHLLPGEGGGGASAERDAHCTFRVALLAGQLARAPLLPLALIYICTVQNIHTAG